MEFILTAKERARAIDRGKRWKQLHKFPFPAGGRGSFGAAPLNDTRVIAIQRSPLLLVTEAEYKRISKRSK